MLDLQNLSNVKFEKAEPLSRLSNLKRLNVLECWNVTNEGFCHLARISSLSHLTLSYDGSQTHGDDARLVKKQSFAGLQDFGRCREGTGLDQATFRLPQCISLKKVFDSLMFLEPIRGLTVEGGRIDASCMWWSLQWNPLTGLTSLKLNPVCNRTGRKDVEILLNCVHLRELQFTGSSVLAFLRKQSSIGLVASIRVFWDVFRNVCQS